MTGQGQHQPQALAGVAAERQRRQQQQRRDQVEQGFGQCTGTSIDLLNSSKAETRTVTSIFQSPAELSRALGIT